MGGVTSAIQTQLNGKLSSTGNAATATKLATARTINGVSFDGTANITLPTNGGMIKAWAIWTETSTGFTSVTPAGFNVSSITKSSATGGVRIVNFTNPITGSYAVIASGDVNTDAGIQMSYIYCVEANMIDSNSCAVMWYPSNATNIPNMFFSVAVIQ